MQDQTIDQIKQRIEILDLVSDYVTLKKSGRNYKGLCPFHTEKTPSFMVNPERGIFKCFGCGKGGDIFKFIQEIDHLEFPEAIRVLAKRAGVEIKDYQASPQGQLRDKILQAQLLSAKFYHTMLTEHSVGRPALEYLKKRGLKDSTIKEWGLGYAPNQWEVVTKALIAKGYSDQDLVATGLGVASEKGRRPYDRFRGRIMFPIRDLTGRVIGFSGRILGDGEPKYMNSPDSLIYQKSSLLFGMDLAKKEIKKQNQAVLVEGNLDVISSFQAGVRNVVAPLGTALTTQQISTLARFTDTISLAFDTDLAGDAATRRGIEMAEEAGLNIQVIHLLGKDPDEMVQTDPAQWIEAVGRSTPIYDFYLESAFNKADSTSPEGKRRIAKEVLPILKKISDPILRGHYLKLVAEKLLVDEKYLEQALGELARPQAAAPKLEVVDQRKSRQHLLEEEIIKLILEVRQRPILLIPDDFTDENLAKIYKELQSVFPGDNKKSLTEQVKFDTPTFVDHLGSEALESFDEILLRLRPEEDLDEDLERKVLLQASRELRRTSLRRLLKKLGLMIKQAQQSGEETKLSTLNKKFSELSAKLADLEVKSA